MNYVAQGQLWSLMNVGQTRYTLRVVRVDDGRVHGTLQSGKPTVVDLSALANGRRGAHLVEHADGTSALLPKYNAGKPLKTNEETRTASDYIRTTNPRGVVKASDTLREALYLYEVEHYTYEKLCEKYGKSMCSMKAWIQKAREARVDERHARMLGRVG